MTDSSRLGRYSKFLNYPSSLSNPYITYRDIIILLKIAEIEIIQNKLTAVDYLYKMIYEQKLYVYVSLIVGQSIDEYRLKNGPLFLI
jgi:hypothetical protein